MKTKKCTKCKKYRTIDNFHKHKACRDGLNTQCKKCVNSATHKYKQEHKDKVLKQAKEYRDKNKVIIQKKQKLFYSKNKEKILEKCKQYREDNKDKIAECNRKYRLKNKDKITAYRKEYRKNNIDKIKKYIYINKKQIGRQHTKYIMERYNSDINFKLSHLLRSRLRNAIERNQKTGSAIRDLGCTVEKLKHHLESLFKDGMSWDNYGTWHIDHIVPLASFDLTKKSHIKKACHYTNLQPLWAKENLKKGAKQ